MSKKLLFVVLMTATTTVHAHEAYKHAECADLKKACETAGFAAGAKTKNLEKDCLNKLAKGETVEGVSLSEHANQTACVAIMNAKGKEHAAKFHHGDKDRVPAHASEAH